MYDKSKSELRAQEIRVELDKLDRGSFPDRVIGRWGTVSTERVTRLKQSYWRELDKIARANRATSDAHSTLSYGYRATNLREIGLAADGRPLNETACRTPCSLARWPEGQRGSEWAARVGSTR